jgi:DNA-binding NarL/FixJ family response regulator
MRTITVLLAEDHAVVREGFRKLLELEADRQVVGEAPAGHQTVAPIKKLRPAMVLTHYATYAGIVPCNPPRVMAQKATKLAT